MLLRQYVRYCERKGFKAEMEDETPGDVAASRAPPSRSKANMPLAFAHRNRVHRLVRSRRSTRRGPSHPFASVFVYPEIDDPSKSISTRLTYVPTPSVLRARVASTSTKPTLPCA